MNKDYSVRASRLSCLALLVLLGGCSFFEATHRQRGNFVSEHDLQELTKGVSTKQDALSLLGPPTTHATFDNNQWIYIGEITQLRVGQLPGIDRQDVVALTFNDSGTLQKVEHLTHKDAKSAPMIARVTPSPGSHANFMQMLLGNIGSVAPTGLSQSATPSGGAPTSAGSTGGGL